MVTTNQDANINQFNLAQLFEEQRFQDIINFANANNISPSNDPNQSFVIAAALFKTDHFAECLLWCDSIAPSLNSDSFYSLHAAALRRVGKFDRAEKLFKQGISEYPQSQSLRNNYANLLIDQKKFDEAEQILGELLKNSPDYYDAIQNMNRLKLLKDINEQNSTQTIKNDSSESSSDVFISDPLHEAFTKEEVALSEHMGLKHKPQEMVSVNQNKKISLPGRVEQMETEEFIDFARNSIEINPEKVIEDCNHLHSQIGIDYRLYALAGEAYIRLQLFSDAENALLTAMGLGCTSDAVYCNLANLAAMRGDQLLALSWLERLAAVDPENENLKKVKDVLFASGLPQKSQAPYQLNLEQRAPGEFKN